MKRIILLIFVLLFSGCNEKLTEEIWFFEDYDVENGEYKLVGYGLEGETIEGYDNFYIDDTETLKKMKKQWVFNKKSKIQPCGYGYALYLVDENEILKKTTSILIVNICPVGFSFQKNI